MSALLQKHANIWACLPVMACRLRKGRKWVIDSSAFTVIVELKGGDGRPYKSAKTFGNYRTWVNKATTLLSRMESEDPGLKQSRGQIQFRRHAHDLLQTPLAEALSLNPSLYGLSSDFCNRLEQCRRVSNRLTFRPELIPSHVQLQQI